MGHCPIRQLTVVALLVCVACGPAETPVVTAATTTPPPTSPPAPMSVTLPGCEGGEVFGADAQIDLEAVGVPARQAAVEILAVLGPPGSSLADRLEPGESETEWVVRAPAGEGDIALVQLVELPSGGYVGTSARACGPAPSPTPTPPSSAVEPSGEVALGLDVSNQSFARPDVRLVVTIDGHEVVDGRFPVGSQHDFYRFPVRLTPGDHELRVTAPEHGEELTEQLGLQDDRYAALSYWGGESAAPLQLELSDEPFAYD